MPELLEHPVAEDRDPVAHRHRLGLIVGDVEGRRTDSPLQRRDLAPHLDPQLRVEVRERLVHQEGRRLANDRPAHRHPLALAAGELARLALEQVAHSKDLGRLGDLGLDLGLRDARHLEPEADVVAHRHVRVERVALKDHRDVALARRQFGDVDAADPDRARRHLLEPGDHPQGRALAAPRGTDEDHELALRDLQRQVVDRDHAAGELLADRLELDPAQPPALSIPRMCRLRTRATIAGGSIASTPAAVSSG